MFTGTRKTSSIAPTIEMELDIVRNITILGKSKKGPAFERLQFPEYKSNDILKYLIE